MIIQNYSKQLKSKILTILLENGKKETSEKLLKFSSKLVQKKTKKRFLSLFKISLVNSAPLFKIKEQKTKKGKRKSIKIVPQFVLSANHRVLFALKLFRLAVKSSSSVKAQLSYQKLADEISNSLSLKSRSIDYKTDYHAKALANKRYLAQFRW